MGLMDGNSAGTVEDPAGHDECVIRAHRCTPDRVVLVEEGNTDAWIASTLTVGPEP